MHGKLGIGKGRRKCCSPFSLLLSSCLPAHSTLLVFSENPEKRGKCIEMHCRCCCRLLDLLHFQDAVARERDVKRVKKSFWRVEGPPSWKRRGTWQTRKKERKNRRRGNVDWYKKQLVIVSWQTGFLWESERASREEEEEGNEGTVQGIRERHNTSPSPFPWNMLLWGWKRMCTYGWMDKKKIFSGETTERRC